jgi:mRNA (guanine-N7-)-methyltransferase
VDCPEWLVAFPNFQALAEQYGLELVLKKNFHDFVHEYSQVPDFADLMRKQGALGDPSTGATISDEEWDAAYIYLAFVFQKVIQLQVWHIFALTIFSLWFTNI